MDQSPSQSRDTLQEEDEDVTPWFGWPKYCCICGEILRAIQRAMGICHECVRAEGEKAQRGVMKEPGFSFTKGD